MEEKEITDNKIEYTSCEGTSKEGQTASPSLSPSHIESYSQTQISDKRVEDNSGKSILEKEQTASPSLSPSHIKSYSQTQISDKNVEDTSSESTSEIEDTASTSLSSSYIKSHSQTQFESTVLDYTWKIDRFLHVSRVCDTLLSPSFSDKDQNTMEIKAVFHKTEKLSCSIKFYVLTSNIFYISCAVIIEYPPKTVLLERSVSGHIWNMKLLTELPKFELRSVQDALIVHCKFEIFHGLVSDTIHMKLLPLSTVFSKDAKHEDSTLDDIQSTVEETIKFIVGKEQYIVSKKLLCATNSAYFKNCAANGDKVKDMTNILMLNEYQAFKQILLYIQTGSIYELQHNLDYAMLKQLFIGAVKFGIPALRLTCEHYLLRYITINNAVELLQLASLGNADFLKAQSTAFIKFHAKEIADTKEFRDLPEKDSSKKIKLI